MKRLVSIIMTMIMVSLLVMSSTSVSFAEGPVYYVYIDGSGYTGDKSCNGGGDGSYDQNEINSAINTVLSNTNYNTIHLRPGTYVINGPILIGGRSGSTITLEGEAGTIIKSADGVSWGTNSGMIRELTSGATKSNFIIKGFKIDGNADNNTSSNGNRGSKYEYESCIFLTGCDTIEVHDMILTDNLCDGLKIKSCNGVKYYNNTIDQIGHDGLNASYCQNVEAYGNRIYLRINCGLRGYNSNHLQFHDNVISKRDGAGGGAGVEIQKNGPDDYDALGNPKNIVNDVKIYNNTIFDAEGPGVYLIGYVETQGNTYPSTSVNAQIYNNLIYHCGLATSNPNIVGGISSHGFNATITNNTIDRCTTANILTRLTYSYDAPTQTTPYTLTVKNNIITNSPGKGLYNDNSKDQITCSYNDVFNNAGGNYSTGSPYPYNNVSPGTGAISSDPLFASAATGDYHLQSKAGRYSSGSWVYDTSMSPCIDTGDPASAYTNEPLFNGGRVNMGFYGNTNIASKSPCLIKNYWQPSYYMHIENQYGYIQYGTINTGWHSARWILEDIGGGLYKIRSYYTGQYMNIESNQSYVQCSTINPDWHSARWSLEQDGIGNIRIRNYWKGTYMHIENLLGYVQCCSLGNPDWYSARWQLAPVPLPY